MSSFEQLTNIDDIEDIEDGDIREVIQMLKGVGKDEYAKTVALYARDAQNRIHKLYGMVLELEEEVQGTMHDITSAARLVWAGVDDE